MILEGLITTTGEDGLAHAAPMGAVVPESPPEAWTGLTLRPYPSTATLANLRRTGSAVFHVTDDVEMIARAAVSQLPPPSVTRAEGVDGWILAGACRWYALRATRIDDSADRAEVLAEIVGQGRLRDFFGLNRAKHAVVEAAILATRVRFLPHDEIRAAMTRLAPLVEKTGGAAERRAFAFLSQYIDRECPR